MAVTFISVSGLLCEKVLQEAESIFSAIRIVDVFQIPHDAPPSALVQFTGLVLLKAMPAEEEFRVGVTLVGSSGERVAKVGQVAERFGLSGRAGRIQLLGLPASGALMCCSGTRIR